MKRVQWLSRIGLLLGFTGIFLVSCSGSSGVATTTTGGNGQPGANPTDTITAPTATLIPTATIAPTPKPAPPGTILFHSDTKTGFSNWTVSGAWKIFDNTLVNDGTGSSSNCGGDIALLAPYQPSTADVAIDALIQFPQNYHANDTGLVARIGSSQNMTIGYSAFVSYSGYIYDVNECNQIASSSDFDFQPQQDVHHFRLEIKGTDMKFYIDGALVVAASDAKYLSPGSVGIFTNQEYIKVSSFTITQL